MPYDFIGGVPPDASSQVSAANNGQTLVRMADEQYPPVPPRFQPLSPLPGPDRQKTRAVDTQPLELPVQEFVREVRGLYETEQSTFGPLFRLTQTLRSEDLREQVTRHLSGGRLRLLRLKSILSALGEHPKAEPNEPLQDLLKYIERHLGQDLGEPMLWKTLRTIVEFEIAAYLNANAHALHLGYAAASDALQQTLRENGNLHCELQLLAWQFDLAV